MPGKIGQDKHQHRRAICPPGHAVSRDGNGGFTFVPFGRKHEEPSPIKTRDAARPGSSIGGVIAGSVTLADVTAAMFALDARMSAIEQRRALQRQLAEQVARQQLLASENSEAKNSAPRTEQPNHQHDHAPQAPWRDGRTTMDRNPQLAPNRHVTFGAFPNPRLGPSTKTRDGNSIEENYRERPSRFTSEEASRMASFLPAGSAGRTSNKEAVNDMNARRDSVGHNPAGPPQPAMTQGSDLSSAFASELQKIPPGQPARAQNVLNQHYNAAKTSDARDAIEKTWKDFQAHYDSRGGNPFAPRQPIVSAQKDANWSSLYEANKGTIGGDPNKISPGMELSLPGGGSHTVQSGETLSGIASTPAGTDLGGKSLAAERGGVEPTGGNYGSTGAPKVSEGGLASSMGSAAPTPPASRPSEFGGSAQAATPSSSSNAETPTPPTKPAEYGGVGESPSGAISPMASEGGGASSTGAEGTGLAKFVRGLVGEQ